MGASISIITVDQKINQKKGSENGHLFFVPVNSTIPIKFWLWITKIDQVNELTGNRHQSANTRHFYPRSYAPGNYVITGKGKSQVDYQNLAKFIRMHQQEMLKVDVFIPTAGQYTHLMNLIINGEGIYTQGWINNFKLSKKGVFEPLPEYTFDFVIAKDQHSKQAISSSAIEKWYTAAATDINLNPFPISPIPHGINQT